MGRWTQFEEDTHRLPHGMKRIGYDADTMVYTFRDEKGKLYRGAPGADYGTLTPLSDNPGSSRPEAFDSGEPRSELPLGTENPPSTFRDILPASLVTTPSASVDARLSRSPRSPISPTSPNEESVHPRTRFIDAVRRTAVPKMQGAVHNLRRSVTTTRAKQPFRHRQTAGENAEYHIIADTSGLSRSPSMATTQSTVSDKTLVDSRTPTRSPRH
ncbi:hypothetical protein BDZ94DRAFT_1321983 [Collybia nuda]|uniref:Uncharacterized protein n=1 Tax=Collybia nuda TaxID=64659 RepID=A0A9P5Y6R8_9AGAR|nr:hypothetical protein BDZ94DRAFT_1321983 [Collybia nuda]